MQVIFLDRMPTLSECHQQMLQMLSSGDSGDSPPLNISLLQAIVYFLVQRAISSDEVA